MNNNVLLTIVIPAYNASNFIRKNLDSIFKPLRYKDISLIEIIVVDDGSDDSYELEKECSSFFAVSLKKHKINKGMVAARNTGIKFSNGQFLTLLDADDQFISDWFPNFMEIINQIPSKVNVCFTTCINQFNQITCSESNYEGWFTAHDIVNGNLAGEYNPIFRGDYIRSRKYIDLGTRKSCGLITYLKMAQEAPFWITKKVMRQYNNSVGNSITSAWTRQDKAAETFICFSKVLDTHGVFIKSINPDKYEQIMHKILIYKMLSNQGRDFLNWWKISSFNYSALGTLILLLIGSKISTLLLRFAKHLGLLRRYG